MPEFCCSDLKPMSSDCTFPSVPTGLSICSKCGDGKCNISNGENKCICPEDCKYYQNPNPIPIPE